MIFDFTPDPKVLLALTRTPMQPLDALCELIDNAIDSFAAAKIQGVPVESPIVVIDLPTKKQLANNSGILRVQDNGPGMTAENAEKAIDLIDKGIKFISDVRSRLGAYQNRLEHTQTNLLTSEENMTAAYSRIMDTDMATEMTEYTNLQVVSQAATSMLAQANERPSQMLQLLQ